MDIVLSRTLYSPYVTLVLLPIVWPPGGSRLEPVLVIITVTIGTSVVMRMPPIMNKILDVITHGKMSRGLWCWQ